jgi:hypothetical protein
LLVCGHRTRGRHHQTRSEKGVDEAMNNEPSNDTEPKYEESFLERWGFRQDQDPQQAILATLALWALFALIIYGLVHGA